MGQAYDIIGDIHGHARPLRDMLTKMGYRDTDGAYHHPDRKVIFLGDFVDRGPAIREVLRIVRAMTEAGAAMAVMGNHEFNALAYATADGQGGFLRPNDDKNTRQHQATLDQIARLHPEEWPSWLDWFRTLPLFLDLGGLRAVHAAWDDRAIALARDLGPLTPQRLVQMLEKKGPYGRMKEVLLNGLEIPLPPGHFFTDKEDHKRTDIRTAWWQEFRGKTYRQIAFPPGHSEPALPVPLELISAEHRAYPPDAPPVFMGHYWLRLKDYPVLQAGNVAILDYSVARGGHLVAYRWDGERKLDPKKFVLVPNPSEEQAQDYPAAAF